MASVKLRAPTTASSTVIVGGNVVSPASDGSVIVDASIVPSLLEAGYLPFLSQSGSAAGLTGTIFVDPQNTSGVANDSAPGTTTVGSATGPVYRTWAGLVNNGWGGTNAPTLSATTAVIFLSSHTDGTDPVIWYPTTVGTGVVVSIQGAAPTVVASGVSLSSVAAKNTTAGSNALLQANLGASGAAGQLVENTTHASRAWAYASLGSNNFEMTQPHVKCAVPGTISPAQVNTWANSDVVNLLTPINVNIVAFIPLISDVLDALSNNQAYIYQLGIFAPTTNRPCYLGNVRVYECSAARLLYGETLHYIYGGLTLTNVFNTGGVNLTGYNCQMWGGAITSAALLVNLSGPQSNNGTEIFMGSDFVWGGPAATCGGQIALGSIFLDNSPTMDAGVMGLFGASKVIYGRAAKNINMRQNSRFYMGTGGTYVAAFTAPALVTGILLNGTATGNSISGGSTINAGISTTPAHLDAAAGAAGFGGTAFNFGGASISNVQ